MPKVRFMGCSKDVRVTDPWSESILGLCGQLEEIVRSTVQEVLSDERTRMIRIGPMISEYGENGSMLLRRDVTITECRDEDPVSGPQFGEVIRVDYKAAQVMRHLLLLVDYEKKRLSSEFLDSTTPNQSKDLTDYEIAE